MGYMEISEMKESDYISDAMLKELKEAYPDKVQGYAIQF